VKKYRHVCFADRVLIHLENSRQIRNTQTILKLEKAMGNALWSPSYFEGSCEEATLDVVKKYIEQQDQPV
jgi:putative transposase